MSNPEGSRTMSTTDQRANILSYPVVPAVPARRSAASRRAAAMARSRGGRGMLPVETTLFDEMLEAWRVRRIGALRHTAETVAFGLGTVREFTDHAGVPPWRWTEDHFDAWCEHLGVERRMTPGSQRKYQTAIRMFLDYVSTNPTLCNRSMQRFGARPVQIVHADNSIPHVLPRETVTARRRFSQDEMSRFFKGLEDSIAEAARFRGKDLLPLMRDKVLFFTIYVLGLRSAEVRGLDVDSFHARTGFSEFGRSGQAIVFGKGSRGSGPKIRTVQVQNKALPEMLDWYCERVRPHFLHRADPNEKALFLSERGRRLSKTGLATRLALALDRAGLGDQGFSPHALRRTMASDLALSISNEAIRRLLGHANETTTALYVEYDDKVIQSEVDAYVRRQIDAARRQREQE